MILFVFWLNKYLLPRWIVKLEHFLILMLKMVFTNYSSTDFCPQVPHEQLFRFYFLKMYLN